ncbi:MAG TPA: thiamine-phosphate kinase [Syntrophorhabdaceae bacterium]|nr:thiamine-phosphate kinase [Syntrophorhabdaceae bacterium]
MEISENLLIKKLGKYGKTGGRVVRGIGDDGAVAKLDKGQYVFVQDAMVEHVHFEFSFLDPYFLGKKIIDVNVSDVLSMGALPLYYLVTLGIPAHVTSKDIERMYRGMRSASRKFNVVLVGGDTVQSDTFFVDVSMTGRLVVKNYIGRDKARAGDLIAVSGYLGEAAYGLALLKQRSAAKGLSRFIRRFQDPAPPLALWKNLVKHDITLTMMDISDGLIVDLQRMMIESGKSAVVFIENIPVPNVLRKNGMIEFSLTGGEDYQLLFTFPARKLSKLESLKKEGHLISVIGEVKKGSGVRFYDHGKEVTFDKRGYEHFGERNG